MSPRLPRDLDSLLLKHGGHQHPDGCPCCFCMQANLTAEVRFWAKVNRDGPVPVHCPEIGPCWVWTGKTFSDGYGSFWLGEGDGEARAHRFSYEWAHGPLGDVGLCHRCDNPPCVRPSHLFPGDHAVNNADMRAKGRARGRFSGATHCIHGHAFTPENTGLRRGGRYCRECGRQKWRRWAARKGAHHAA